MRHFVFRWAVTAFAVFVAAPIVALSYSNSLACLLGASLLLGIANAFVRPVLLILSAPLILLSLGFFILVVNEVTVGDRGGNSALLYHSRVLERILRRPDYLDRELASERFFPGE